MQTSELIERLEQATGPDRELNAAIYEVLTGKCPHIHIMTVAGDGDGWGEVCSRCCEEEPEQVFKPYTASIDAALTLVPASKGHESWWMLKAPWRGKAKAEIWVDGKGKPFKGEASTPALAICIAALRARNEGEGA